MVKPVTIKDESEINAIIDYAHKNATPVTVKLPSALSDGNFDTYKEKDIQIVTNTPLSVDKYVKTEAEVKFHYSGSLYEFKTFVNKSLGNRIYLRMPKTMTCQQKRQNNRITVKDNRIPVKFLILQTENEKKLSAKPAKSNPLYISMLEELRKSIPEISRNVQLVKKALEGMANNVDVHLGSIDSIFHPAKTVLNKLKAVFFVQDTRDERGMLEKNVNLPMVYQFFHFMDIECQDSSPEAQKNFVNEWQQKYHERKIVSEAFIPIKIIDSIAGYIHLSNNTGALDPISLDTVNLATTLAEVLSETLVKRNLNNSIKKGTFHAAIFDISETGIGFRVDNQLFKKIMEENSDLKIVMNFFGQWINLTGKVIRVNRDDDGSEGIGFAVNLDMMAINKKDQIQFKRVINYFNE